MKCPFIGKWDCPLLDPNGEGNCPIIKDGYCLLIDEAIRESVHEHQLSDREKEALHKTARNVVMKVLAALRNGGENECRDRQD